MTVQLNTNNGTTYKFRSARARATGKALRVVLMAVLGGCSQEPQSLDGEPTQADRERFRPRISVPDYARKEPRRVVLPSTGDADHDFLRRMSDHHKDVIRTTHAAIEANKDPTLHSAIRKVEEEHDHTLDAMLSLLRNIYNDAYVPQTNAVNDATAERLRKSSSDYNKIFLAAAESSEQEANRILKDYLPKSKNQRVRRLAARLADEERSGMTALRNALTSR